ncbi:hypothetical protein EDC53_10398 [Phytobacter diazotrophicus]|nr:hypothetical protein EDC53_10398 [Phytobacter diazotrophicus]
MANAHQRQRIVLDNDPAVNNRFERIRTRPVAILALAILALAILALAKAQ